MHWKKMPMKKPKTSSTTPSRKSLTASCVTTLLLVGGDFNAQVSSDHSGPEAMISPHGIANATNESGEHLISFCVANHLVLKYTYFAHKRIHKMTWKDIFVSFCWSSTITDVKVWHGAILIELCYRKLVRSFWPVRIKNLTWLWWDQMWYLTHLL